MRQPAATPRNRQRGRREMAGGRRALFLDRDGTVCVERGFLARADDVELIPGSATAVRLAREAGFRIVVVSNQSGVARGYFDEAAVAAIHARLADLLAREGATLDGIYYCPHHPKGVVERLRDRCDCRKPAPGMLLRARDEMGLRLRGSYTIGDRWRDVEAGARAGTRSILVLTGYGRAEFGYHSRGGAPPPLHVAEDLLAAVRWILDHEESDVQRDDPGSPEDRS